MAGSAIHLCLYRFLALPQSFPGKRNLLRDGELSLLRGYTPRALYELCPLAPEPALPAPFVSALVRALLSAGRGIGTDKFLFNAYVHVLSP